MKRFFARVFRERVCKQMSKLMCVAMCGLILSGVVSLASMSVASAAPGGSKANGVRVRSNEAGFALMAMDGNNGERFVRILFKDGKTLNARFDRDGRPDRVWFVPVEKGGNFIRSDEQVRIRKFLLREGERLRRADREAFGLLDMAANFFPANEKIEPFDAAKQFGVQSWRSLDFTLICFLRGLEGEGSFTARGGLRRVKALIGEKQTSCRGRCGTGCQQIGQYRVNQYTQECLNHDLCRDATGENLGQCSDEFWTAAAGYTLAPDCD